MKYLAILLSLVLPLAGQTLTNTNLDGVTNATLNGVLDDNAAATIAALGLGTAATAASSDFAPSSLLSTADGPRRTVLLHDDGTGTNASLADEEDRVMTPGPGTLKVKALPASATVRYENGEMLLYPGPSGTAATFTLASSGVTLSAGMTMIVRVVPGNVRGQQGTFFATFSSSYGLLPHRGGIQIETITSTSALNLNVSTLATDTDDNWRRAGYSALNEGEEIALAIHHKTLSHQQYYMQGGRAASMGCFVGSDNWFLIDETFTALSGTVYPMIGSNYAGVARIRDIKLLSSWSPGVNSVSHETSRTFKGIHIPYLQKDPVSGLVMQAWNSGLVHYGATANINIKYSTRLADGTWTTAGTLLADGGGDEGNQFCHLSVVNGKLWMVYVPINWATTTVDEGGPIYRREITINATTGAATVGAAVSLGVGTKAISFSEIVQTDTGRYVLPYQEDSGTIGSGIIKPRFAYSDDNGTTWTTVAVGTGVNPGSSAYFAEQTITKEASGALGTYIRTADTAWYSRSTDNGVTWSQPTARTELPMPGSFGCRLNARNLADGSGAILVGNDHQFQRRNITLWKVDTTGAVVWKKRIGDLTDPAFLTTELYAYTQMQYPNVLFDDSENMLMAISLQHGSNTIDLVNSMRTFTFKTPLKSLAPDITGADELFKNPKNPRANGAYKLVYSTAPIPDMSVGRLFHVTLTASTAVLGVPLNPLPWDEITLVFVQGGAGSFTATFNAIFEFGSITPTWLTAVGATNTLKAYYNPLTAKWVVTSWN